MSSGNRDRAYAAVERDLPSHVEYHEPTRTYRTLFDHQDRLASDAVISVVSAAIGVGPMELPPIYTAVDPDALDRLFAPRTAGSSRSNGSVTFEYVGHRVTVNGHGSVEVEPPDGRGERHTR